MKAVSINLYDAVFFLQQCTGVLLEDRFVDPVLYKLEEDPENEFVTLEWDEIDETTGNPSFVQVGFKEGDNETAELCGCFLTLMDDTGKERTLTLLQEWHPLFK